MTRNNSAKAMAQVIRTCCECGRDFLPPPHTRLPKRCAAVECKRAARLRSLAKWRATHKAERAKYIKAWRADNQEHVAAYDRKHRIANQARENKRLAEWVERNHGRRRAQVARLYKRRVLALIDDPVLREIREVFIDLRGWQRKHPGQLRTGGDAFGKWFRELARER